MRRAGLVTMLLLALPALSQPEPRKPAPALAAAAAPVSAAPRSLAEVARERTRGKGSFSAATSTAPRAHLAGVALPQDEQAVDAQERMNQAVERGIWTRQNVRYNENRKQAARSRWDAAAENCRQTPGCRPVYRDPKDDLPFPPKTTESHLPVAR